MKILYVEDDPRDADLTRRWLLAMAPQLTLETAPTQSDAVARLNWQGASPPYDLVLTDLRLPDGDGLSLLNYIRERGLPLAVVVITGTGDEETAVAALKAGADDYVAKRNDYLERLPLTLESALNRHRARIARKARPLKALYAEHHHADIDLTRRHFQRYAPHIHLDVAPTAAETLARLSQAGEANRYDVILLDYNLPGMNALEALKELRQGCGLDLPVVVVTGQGDEESASQALKLGAASYIVKNPGYLHQLPSELENAHHRAELLREQVALRASEERFAKAFHSNPQPMSITTLAEGRYVDVNECWLRMSGYTREEVIGHTSIELNIWGSLEERVEFVNQLQAQGALRNLETQFHTKGGGVRVLLSSAELIELSGRRRILTSSSDITERKLAEAALAEKELRLRESQAIAHVGSFHWDVAANTVAWSDELCRIYGLEPGESSLTYETYLQQVHPDHQEQVRRAVERALTQREPFEHEYRIVRPTGETRWVFAHCRPVVDADGKVIALQGICQDITERKRTRESLRESEVRNRAMLEAIPDMIFLLTRDGVYLDFHAQDPRVLLVLPEQFLGKNMRDVLPPELAERFAKCFEEVAQSGQIGLVEYSLPILGEERHYEVRVVNCDHDKVLSLARDVTERKQAEERFLKAFRSSPQPMSITTLEEGRYVDVNERFLEVSGYAREEVIGRTSLELNIWESPEARAELVTPLEEGRVVRNLETKFGTKGGEFRVFLSSSELIELGRQRCVLVASSDITERKRAEAAHLSRTALRADINAALAERQESLQSILQRCAEAIVRHLDAAFARIWTLNQKEGVLELRASAGLYTHLNGRHSRVGVGELKIGQIAEDRQPLLTNDVCNDPRVNDREWAKEQGMVAFAGYPLLVEDRVVGVMAMFARHHLTEDAVEALATVAAPIAQGIERKRAEQALSESEERFRQLAENIGAAFFITEGFSQNSPGRVIYVSPAYEKIWGRTRRSVYKNTRSWLDAVYSEDRERVLAALHGAGQAHFDEEFRIVRPDGEIRWVHDRVFPIRGARGEIYRLAGIVEDITERKQIEEALRESQSRYSLATMAGGVGVWDWNLETNEIYVDPTLKAVLGFEDHEIENLIDDWGGRIHPEDADRVMAEAQAHIDGLTPCYEVEHRMRHKDGSVRWFLARGTVVESENGHPRRMVGTDTDITERKRVEQALRESEERFRLMIDTAPVMVWISGADALCNFFNQPWLDFTGRTMEQELGNGWAEGVHPEDYQRCLDTYLMAFAARERFSMEYRLRRSDGEYRWVFDEGIPRFTPAGFIGYIGSCIDITERKQMEQALRESEERARRTLVEQMLAGVAECDADRKFVLVNQRFCDITGYTEAELLEMRVDDIMRPDDVPGAAELHHRLVASGESFVSEKRYRRKDGSEVWVNANVSPIRSGRSRGEEAVAVVIDITDRKLVEREREQLLKEAQAANRSKDEFLAVVSHELRNPLNSILGYTRHLRTAAPDEADIKKTAEIIERSGKMQLQLIEDLLDSARIISGKLKLEVQPVSLDSVINAALDVMRPAAQAKGIELRSNLDPLAGQITGDPSRLQQVVWNLLSNAIKFTPQSGIVELRMEIVDRHLRITVKDTGKGIEPEFLPFVFDRFRQSDASSARRFGGLGLGLSLVKQLVELHGGTIEAASDGPGRGATFTMTLPQHSAQIEALPPERPRAVAARKMEMNDAVPLDQVPSLAGVRVLVVDDEEDARLMLKDVLGESGARVMAVSSGVEALAMLADSPAGARPDALILDINMPDEDGYKVLERVRALEAKRGVAQSERVPAIALTAMGRTEDRLKSLAAGFRMHVAKPVEPGELVVVIASLVERLSVGKSV